MLFTVLKLVPSTDTIQRKLRDYFVLLNIAPFNRLVYWWVDIWVVDYITLVSAYLVFKIWTLYKFVLALFIFIPFFCNSSLKCSYYRHIYILIYLSHIICKRLTLVRIVMFTLHKLIRYRRKQIRLIKHFSSVNTKKFSVSLHTIFTLVPASPCISCTVFTYTVETSLFLKTLHQYLPKDPIITSTPFLNL